MIVLNPHLLVQRPALLQLGFTLKELVLGLVQLGLEVTGLVTGVIQLNLGLVQLGFDLAVMNLCLLQLGLALLELDSELLLGGVHGGGNLLRHFEELTSTLLQTLQLLGTTEQID